MSSRNSKNWKTFFADHFVHISVDLADGSSTKTKSYVCGGIQTFLNYDFHKCHILVNLSIFYIKMQVCHLESSRIEKYFLNTISCILVLICPQECQPKWNHMFLVEFKVFLSGFFTNVPLVTFWWTCQFFTYKYTYII